MSKGPGDEFMCYNCKAFNPTTEHDYGMGQCRLRAPTNTTSESPTWPVTHSYDWCLEFVEDNWPINE